VIGCHKPNFFTDFFNELGITMTPIICNFLGAKERKKGEKRKYQKQVDVKINRSKKQKKQLEETCKE